MRIISDWHDYYDSVQAMGQDLTLVYLRKLKEVTWDHWPFAEVEMRLDKDWRIPGINFQAYVIGFCGKIYPCIRSWGFGTSTSAFFTLEELDKAIQSRFKEEEHEAYCEKGKVKYWRQKFWRRNWSFHQRRELFEKWFSECYQNQDRYQNLFFDNKCPIFSAKLDRQGGKITTQVVLNAELKPFNFVRVMDTFTAFQEISMFVSNLAVPLNEIPEVSDKDMVTAKGFDDWSFRKLPTKKK